MQQLLAMMRESSSEPDNTAQPATQEHSGSIVPPEKKPTEEIPAPEVRIDDSPASEVTIKEIPPKDVSTDNTHPSDESIGNPSISVVPPSEEAVPSIDGTTTDDPLDDEPLQVPDKQPSASGLVIVDSDSDDESDVIIQAPADVPQPGVGDRVKRWFKKAVSWIKRLVGY